MYSPKISDDLIPKIYHLAKAEKKPMTRVVDEILRNYLDGLEIEQERATVKEPAIDGGYRFSIDGL